MIVVFVSLTRVGLPPAGCIDAGHIALAHSRSKAVSPLASRADASYFCGDKSNQNRSCREGARQTAPGPLRCSVRAGRAELAPLRSLRHAARLFPPGPVLLGAIEADGLAPSVPCLSQLAPVRDEPAPGRRRRRVSQPRTGISGSACLSDRRERVRNRPFAARNAGNRASGPAASHGSVSWLLLGAPRSDSPKPAQPAAKPLLILVDHRSYQLRSTPERLAPSNTIGGQPLK
jgi:hypothetical protein